VSFVAFAVEDQLVVSIGADQYLRFWDAGTGQELATYPGAGLATMAPDGQTLAVLREGVIQLWDLKTRKITARLQNLPPDSVAQMAFSPDGAVLAASSPGQHFGGAKWQASFVLWDLKTGQAKT